jgi:hypothetical protein
VCTPSGSWPSPAEKVWPAGRGSRPRVEIQETPAFIISEEQEHKRYKTLSFAKYCRKCSRFAVGVIAMPSKRRAAVSAPYGHAGPGRHPHPHPARSKDAEPTFAFDRAGECRDGRRLWDAELADAKGVDGRSAVGGTGGPLAVKPGMSLVVMMVSLGWGVDG